MLWEVPRVCSCKEWLPTTTSFKNIGEILIQHRLNYSVICAVNIFDIIIKRKRPRKISVMRGLEVNWAESTADYMTWLGDARVEPGITAHGSPESHYGSVPGSRRATPVSRENYT